jgi:hypothetical protein
MNWNRIFWRLSWPALLVIAVGFACDLLLGRFFNLYATTLAHDAAPIPLVGLAVGLALAALWIAVAALRLRRWESGDGPYCRHCSGPVGFKQDGKSFHGKRLADFRRCYNCRLISVEPAA